MKMVIAITKVQILIFIIYKSSKKNHNYSITPFTSHTASSQGLFLIKSSIIFASSGPTSS